MRSPHLRRTRARKLLVETKGAPTEVDKSPGNNPFAMSAAWRATLVKPEPAGAPPTAVQAPGLPAQPVKPQINLEQIKLQGIVREGGKWIAVINGQFVSVGDRCRQAA